MRQVLGIREAKGLDFAEVVIVDFSRCLDERQQASWKQLLQASPCDGKAKPSLGGRNASQAPVYSGYPLAEAPELC
jgi:hypothetical protein